MEQSFSPTKLHNYEAHPRSPPDNLQRSNPNSRLGLSQSLSSPSLGGDWIRSKTSRATRTRIKRWTSKWPGSRACLVDGFGWTDVRRKAGFGDAYDPKPHVVSFDAHRKSATEVPVHDTLAKKPGRKDKGPVYKRPSYARYRPSSSQRALSGESPLQFPEPASRPSTSQSTARSELRSRGSSMSGGCRSGGSSDGSVHHGAWDVAEFLLSMERANHQSAIAPPAPHLGRSEPNLQINIRSSRMGFYGEPGECRSRLLFRVDAVNFCPLPPLPAWLVWSLTIWCGQRETLPSRELSNPSASCA